MSKKVFVLYTLYFVLTIMLPDYSAAQTGQYSFRHLTVEDGLPTSRCEYITKDSHGFMWFGTKLGLCRYDGYNFKVYEYDPDDSTSVSSSNIKTNIVEDQDGYLWVGNFVGLNRFDPVTEKFKRFVHDPDDSSSLTNNFVVSLCLDRSGIIWVGMTSEGGLCRYNSDKGNFSRFKLKSYENNNIYTIHEDRSGVLWVGTTNGLFQFDRQNKIFIPIKPVPPLPNNFVPDYRTIKEDDAGILWFVTEKAILNYNREDGDSVVLRTWPGGEMLFNECYARDILVETIEGGQILWIATCGLARINTVTWDINLSKHDPTNPESITGPNVFNIFEDEAGTFWISSRQFGINILEKESYQIEKHSDFYQQYGCNATIFFEHSDGSIWVGTSNKGVIRFDNQMNQIKWYDVLYRDENGKNHTGIIWTMYEDDEGNLWLGDYNSGLYFFDRSEEKFVHCELEGLIVGQDIISINDIYKDSHGVLWIATQFGLYKREQWSKSLLDFKFIILSDLLHWHRPVNCVFEDSMGVLWFCGNGSGLFCQTQDLRGTDTFINYSHDPKNKNSLGSNNVWKISEDSHANLWVSTYHGLNIYNRESDSFERIKLEINPASNFISDFVDDKNGYFWMTTNYGLLRFKIPTINKQDKAPIEINQFLRFTDIFSHKISKLKNGKICVGARYSSENGYFSFYPDSIKDNERIPPVVFTDFTLNNNTATLDTSIVLKKHIILNHNENFFSIEFSALDYTNPKENKYAYWLEGYEDEWTYSGTRRNAYYTGVPPGQYTFRAKGSNNDGYWNEKGTSIMVTILPPPWRTWWAYTLYGLSLIGLFIGWRRYDIKRQRLKQDLELEHIESEKLKELDSMKSRFFANISHEFRTPLTLILGALEKHLQKIKDKDLETDMNIMRRNARRLQNLINQLLDLSKLESGKMQLRAKEENMVELVKSYVQQFESMAKQKHIDLVFESEEDIISAYVDRDKIENVLYNLVSNAFKFTSGGGRIEVILAFSYWPLAISNKEKMPKAKSQKLKADQNNQAIEIKISDSGAGIPPEKLPHIFDRFYQADDSYTKDQEGTGIGLALTKELVELHHGVIEVESEMGKGSVFCVYLPLGREHLNFASQSIGNRRSAISNHAPEEQPATCNLQPATNEVLPQILIVEDNTDLRQYIRGLLNEEFGIIEAEDGQQGFEMAIENVPDLILSDVMMPKMDGYELCKNLKRDERTSHIPVIMLTARAGKESRIEGLETGADDFISKPFDAEELQVRIRNLIEQRKKLQERFIKNFRKLGIDHFMDIETPDLSSMDQQFIRKALNLVIENISDPDLNVEKLSSEMAVSRRQLHRKIVAITGESSVKFIRSIRLNKAAEMIKSKSANISEVAYEVGYSNLSYFSRAFKEEFGVIPSEYN